jgi:hypothetical protein
MIIKPLTAAEDIQAAALADAAALAGTLLWVVNTHSNAAKVTVANASPVTVYIPANAGMAIKKEPGAVVEASTGGSSVWATLIAYGN